MEETVTILTAQAVIDQLEQKGSMNLIYGQNPGAVNTKEDGTIPAVLKAKSRKARTYKSPTAHFLFAPPPVVVVKTY
jgi:hypothetical protein